MVFHAPITDQDTAMIMLIWKQASDCLNTVMRLLFLKALTPYLKQELGLINTMTGITKFTVTVESAISLHLNALMVKVMK